MTPKLPVSEKTMDNENGEKQKPALPVRPTGFSIIFPLVGLFLTGLFMALRYDFDGDLGLAEYVSVAIAMLLFGAYLDFLFYIVRITKKSDITALICFVLTIIIVGFIAAIMIPNYLRQIDQGRYMYCLQSLSGLKVAEEMYITDNGVYSNKGLAVFLVPGEEKPSPEGDKKLEERISRSCDGPAPGKAWTLDQIEISPDKMNYTIRGRSKGIYHCLITVTPKGYEPDSYKGCIERWKKGPYFAAQFRKQRIYAALVMFLSALSLFIYMYLKYRPRKNIGVIQPEVD